MEKQDRAAYINAQSACAMIEAMAMQAENTRRKQLGESLAYTETDFCALIERYGISHNATVAFLDLG